MSITDSSAICITFVTLWNCLHWTVSSSFGTAQSHWDQSPKSRESVPEFSSVPVAEGILQVMPHGNMPCHWWRTCNEIPAVLLH
jgi:hypothetical protein